LAISSGLRYRVDVNNEYPAQSYGNEKLSEYDVQGTLFVFVDAKVANEILEGFVAIYTLGARKESIVVSKYV
jgi:hypothetical protein